jgi:hypothetical protein
MAWFRRNNTKLMAFVVIVLMLVFVLEPAMNYLSWRRAGGYKVVGRYGDNQKITSKDLTWAQQQLELLRLLGANIFLRPQDPRLATSQDLQTVLLGELLLAERATGVESIGRIKQIVGRGNYGITDKQINDIYSKSYPPNMYWLLLAKEAHLAGVRIPVEAAKAQLEAIIPRLAKGATYEQLVGSIVERHSVSEEQVLATFADLMAVIEYGRMMCSMQNMTAQQVLHEAAWQQETIDAEYVLFDSSTFAGQARRPSEEKIVEHFEKYKGTFAGDISEDNPYGFGYKLPERVALEYIAVRLDDIASTVTRPTQQETEEYYQQHLSVFTQGVPSDPNDPNSPMKAQTRSYAEVAALISKGLYQQRVDSKAEQILLEAKSITEANLAGIDSEQSKLTDEQIKKLAIDYEKTAAQLSEKHKLKVHAGKTGLLSASDIQGDAQLGILYLGSAGFTNAGLVRAVFAVEQLKTSELGPLDVRPPRLYENIGPLKDALEPTEGYGGKNMMLVRVIAAEKAAEPKSVDEKLDRRTVRFDQKPAAGEDTNSVRELVIEDLKRFAAMDKTNEKANQFVQVAAKDGWDAAVDKFNELYGSAARKTDANAVSNDKKTFALQTRTGLRRIPDTRLATLETRHKGNPMAKGILDRTRAEGMLVDKLCAVLPNDANTLASSGAIVEFKPTMSYYCLKSLTIHQLYQEQFDKAKAMVTINDDFVGSQAFAAVHYNPENILKRMNFSIIKEPQDATRPGAANEPNAPSGPVGGD